MYKAASARFLLRSLPTSSTAPASSVPGKSRLAASARLALPRPRVAGHARTAAAAAWRWSGTGARRFAGARAQQIGAAVPAVERFQRRMATQGASAFWIRLARFSRGGLGVIWVTLTWLAPLPRCARPTLTSCCSRLKFRGVLDWNVDRGRRRATAELPIRVRSFAPRGFVSWGADE
jgi:hypothetical protein